MEDFWAVLNATNSAVISVFMSLVSCFNSESSVDICNNAAFLKHLDFMRHNLTNDSSGDVILLYAQLINVVHLWLLRNKVPLSAEMDNVRVYESYEALLTSYDSLGMYY